jgi:hypothetical protein
VLLLASLLSASSPWEQRAAKIKRLQQNNDAKKNGTFLAERINVEIDGWPCLYLLCVCVCRLSQLYGLHRLLCGWEMAHKTHRDPMANWFLFSAFLGDCTQGGHYRFRWKRNSRMLFLLGWKKWKWAAEKKCTTFRCVSDGFSSGKTAEEEQMKRFTNFRSAGFSRRPDGARKIHAARRLPMNEEGGLKRWNFCL